MSKPHPQTLSLTAIWLLAGVMFMGDFGCSQHSRRAALPRSSPPGLSRVTAGDSGRDRAETSAGSESADTVTNTATGLSVETESEDDGDLFASESTSSSDPLDADELFAAAGIKPPKPTPSSNPISRLINRINDNGAAATPAENGDSAADKTAVLQAGSPAADTAAGADEISETAEAEPPERSRGQRLLSLLRLPWTNNEEAEADASKGDDLDDDEQTPELGPADATDVLSFNEDPTPPGTTTAGENELELAGDHESPKTQPWGETGPALPVTGVSNQSITTLGGIDEPAEVSELPDDGTLLLGQNDADQGDPSAAADDATAEPPVDPAEIARAERRARIRRAIFPESSTSSVNEEFEEPAEKSRHTIPDSAEVIKIPNRLPTPEVRGTAKSWPKRLTSPNLLFIAAVAIVALMLSWGTWRRIRTRFESQ